MAVLKQFLFVSCIKLSPWGAPFNGYIYVTHKSRNHFSGYVFGNLTQKAFPISLSNIPISFISPAKLFYSHFGFTHSMATSYDPLFPWGDSFVGIYVAN